MQFVRGDRHRVDVEVSKAERDFSDGLDRIAVDRDGMGSAEMGDLLDGLQNSRFVVGEHDGDESDGVGSVLNAFGQRGQLDHS